MRKNVAPDWLVTKTNTIGTVTKISCGKRGGVWFTHEDNGKIYEEFDGFEISGLVIEEK